MQDSYHHFFSLYQQGNVSSAIALIVPTPDIAYDSLVSKERFFSILVNYVDAMVFGNFNEAYHTNLGIYSILTRQTDLAATFAEALFRLKMEQNMLSKLILEKRRPLTLNSLPLTLGNFLQSESTEELLTPQATADLIRRAPEKYQAWLQQELALSQGWIAFKQRCPKLASLYNTTSDYFTRPWYPLRYASPLVPRILGSGDVPMIFLEPLNVDFTSFLTPLKQHPAVFVFETRSRFIQMLQFPEVLESLCEKEHFIYILELYPNDQMAAQQGIIPHGSTLQPMLITPNDRVEATLPVMTQALSACLNQSEATLASDSENGNWLYHISRRLRFASQGHRLGTSRIPALIEHNTVKGWYDPHKTLPSKDKDLGPPPPNYIETRLRQFAELRSPWKKKIRLAHIVPQIVDSGHAPSRLLENLIVKHDRQLFDLYVISTERFQFHPFEYPFSLANSDSSADRAQRRIKLFRSLGVKVHLFDSLLSYEKAAHDIALMLQQLRVDVAVFHGPDIIHSLCTQMAGVPLHILFEHGTPPQYPGFELVIASSRDAPEIYRELFADLKTEVHGLPFALDVRALWPPEILSKTELGLPPDCIAITTISNQLDSRLGKEMCLAIVEILKRIPNAHYAPIGPVFDEERLRKFFRQHGVDHRITFLGRVANASLYARSMQLYLNEFPFGGCLGILDAMASGLPVVTMHDLHGPPQARYGGDFIGIDRAITSGKREDYVKHACRLLTDPMMYQEWSEHSKQQYEKHADVDAYVKAFETIVKDAFQRIGERN